MKTALRSRGPSEKQTADVNIVNSTFVRFTECTSTRNSRSDAQLKFHCVKWMCDEWWYGCRYRIAVGDADAQTAGVMVGGAGRSMCEVETAPAAAPPIPMKVAQ